MLQPPSPVDADPPHGPRCEGDRSFSDLDEFWQYLKSGGEWSLILEVGEDTMLVKVHRQRRA